MAILLPGLANRIARELLTPGCCVMRTEQGAIRLCPHVRILFILTGVATRKIYLHINNTKSQIWQIITNKGRQGRKCGKVYLAYQNGKMQML